MISSTLTTLEEMTGLSWKQLIGRIAFGFVFTSWIGFLPTYMIIHYMIEQRFFSYDMFTDGIFGINSFVFVSGIILVLISYALFGFLPFAWSSYLKRKHKAKENIDRVLAWVFIIVASTFHLFLFLKLLYTGRLIVYFTFVVLGLAVCVFSSLLVGKSFKEKLLSWIPSAVFIFLTAIFPLISQDANSKVVSLALKTFRIGGSLNVTALSKDKLTQIASGKLTLQTPKNIYIISEESELITIPYSNEIIIKVNDKQNSRP